jgi:toxin ParE1/3/4
VTLPLVVHPDADVEIEEAAVWYEARRAGLGLEFMAAVDRVPADVAEASERFPTWRRPWRRAVMRRFPFVVFFEVEDDRVVVWAVAHVKRTPGYWVARRVPGDAE